jgi:hypothetical protein
MVRFFGKHKFNKGLNNQQQPENIQAYQSSTKLEGLS